MKLEIKNENKNNWLFADSYATDNVRFIFKDAVEKKGQTGNTFPVFLLEQNGFEYQTSAYKTKIDYSAMVNKFGAETDDWKGRYCDLTVNNEKFVLTPFREENIQNK